MHTYKDGNAAVPTKVVKNKKEVLLDFFVANKGQWISRDAIAAELERNGMQMNQVTARISDLRDDLFVHDLFIDSRQIDEGTSQWEYKLDILTKADRDQYLSRRSGTQNQRLIENLAERIKLLEKKLDEAPIPSLDSPLSLGEWDKAYEDWYNTRSELTQT